MKLYQFPLKHASSPDYVPIFNSYRIKMSKTLLTIEITPLCNVCANYHLNIAIFSSFNSRSRSIGMCFSIKSIKKTEVRVNSCCEKGRKAEQLACQDKKVGVMIDGDSDYRLEELIASYQLFLYTHISHRTLHKLSEISVASAPCYPYT